MWNILARSLLSTPATIDGPAAEPGVLAGIADRLRGSAQARLGRSLAIRVVDAGSCNACELELHALSNPVYDLSRFGLHVVASPRHADVLMVTGPVTHNMAEALKRTHEAMPAPKWVVAVGDCACTGGVFAGSYACAGAVETVLPVDIRISGCPPNPVKLLEGLLALIEANGPATR